MSSHRFGKDNGARERQYDERSVLTLRELFSRLIDLTFGAESLTNITSLSINFIDVELDGVSRSLHFLNSSFSHSLQGFFLHMLDIQSNVSLQGVSGRYIYGGRSLTPILFQSTVPNVSLSLTQVSIQEYVRIYEPQSPIYQFNSAARL